MNKDDKKSKKEFFESLINELKKFTEVKNKENLKRLLT
jgi:hypothetical protein